MPEGRRNEKTIRVMTYNIHRWAGYDRCIDVARMAQVIRAADADVVGLNEVLHPVWVNTRVRNLLPELAERLQMEYAFGPSGWVDRGPGWEGVVGNALLSRYPLAGVSNSVLPQLLSTKKRSLLGATLKDGPAAGLAAYVTHLDHAFEGTRLLQIEGLLRYVSHSQPHFVAGDFNAPGFVGRRTHRFLPPVLRRMRSAGYQDAFRVAGSGHGRTFPSRSPLWRIDFLFFPNRWAAGLRSAHALDLDVTRHASDHRPVLVEWGWPADAIA